MAARGDYTAVASEEGYSASKKRREPGGEVGASAWLQSNWKLVLLAALVVAGAGLMYSQPVDSSADATAPTTVDAAPHLSDELKRQEAEWEAAHHPQASAAAADEAPAPAPAAPPAVSSAWQEQ